MEGGTLGSNYFGFNANTNDNGNWSVIGNCVNQNYSVFYGGYMGSIQPYCADPNNGIFPTSDSGNMPIFIGASGGLWPIGAPGIVTGIGNNMQINGGMVFSQNGTSLCLTGGGAYLFGFSSDNACGSPSTWYTRWNTSINAFDLDHWVGSNELSMRYAAADNGYPGYAGPTGTGVIFPYGILVNNVEDAGNETADARLICLSKVLPTNANHKKGDICFNTDPTHGGPVGWTDMADGANFERGERSRDQRRHGSRAKRRPGPLRFPPTAAEKAASEASLAPAADGRSVPLAMNSMTGTSEAT